MKKLSDKKFEPEKENMVIILSTFSSDIAYDVNDTINGLTSVVVNGISGLNILDDDSLFITPINLSTKISKSLYELLKSDHVFCRHLKDGYLKVEFVDEVVQEDIDKDVSIEEDKEVDEKKEDNNNSEKDD